MLPKGKSVLTSPDRWYSHIDATTWSEETVQILQRALQNEEKTEQKTLPDLFILSFCSSDINLSFHPFSAHATHTNTKVQGRFMVPDKARADHTELAGCTLYYCRTIPIYLQLLIFFSPTCRHPRLSLTLIRITSQEHMRTGNRSRLKARCREEKKHLSGTSL